MDLRERFDDPVEATRAAMDGRQAQIQTSMPGIIQSYDPERQTCTVQPAIKGRVEAPDGTVTSVALPLLVDVPVIFPSGGGCILTFPIEPGDECEVRFASRCIDAWWQSGGVQEPLSTRMHDLSDGFAYVGPRSQARKLTDVSTTETQLRSDDGSVCLGLNPVAKTLTVKAPGGVVYDTPLFHCTGDITAGNISLEHHEHSDPQGGNTGGPE